MDSSILALIFWGSITALFYAYIGYPLLLSVIRGSAPRESYSPASLPTVSVIVAAYNEEKCIREKVQNLLRHDYPEDRLEVLVVSDGSTDRTESIVSGLAGPRVRLLCQPSRQGKNMALNHGAGQARGEILVFTDANAMLAPAALRGLVAPFQDPTVGLVSGQGLYGDMGNGTTRIVSNAYVRYEAFIRKREAELGFLAGVDGALYAMRRTLYSDLGSNQVHDLMHPIAVALAGYRSAFEPSAFTVEPSSEGSGKEFQRHVRIIAQGCWIFVAQVPVLIQRGHIKGLWMLVSHRLLRYASSVFLLAALWTNLALLGSHPIYFASWIAQSAFYALAVAGGIGEQFCLRFRLIAIPYYFCVVSAAGAGGFLQFLRGRGHAVWTPRGAAGSRQRGLAP